MSREEVLAKLARELMILRIAAASQVAAVEAAEDLIGELFRDEQRPDLN